MDTGLASGNIRDLKTDCLVLGITQEEGGKQSPALRRLLDEVDQALDGAIRKGLEEGEITGKKNETVLLHTLGKLPAKRIMFVGLGKKDELNFTTVREAAGFAVKQAAKNRITRMVFSFQSAAEEHFSLGKMAHAISEGALLANYRFAGYKKQKEEEKRLEELLLYIADESDPHQEEGWKRGIAYAEATNLARDLVNVPGNLLPPTVMAEEAIKVAKRHGMEVNVLDEKDMEKLGMGAILAVAKGSEQPPRMVVIKYKGKKTWKDVIGLVGKGVSFDTGGISLKPVQGMGDMIGDMGGAAAVIGAMDAIGTLRPKANVMAVLPMAENMPSGSAYRPGDVIPSMSGHTIEIITTDAEGRLLLADAITYARELGVSRLVDVATLTGAVTVALGTKTTAVMSNDEEWVEDVLEAAIDAGELMWRLPVFDAYREQYKSRKADFKNSGGRHAGTITAGMFLGEFAADTPWAHLDIAGTSWIDNHEPLASHGGTGVMARTLIRLVENSTL